MIKYVLATIIGLVAAVFGIILLTAPSRERQAVEYQQDTLLQGIERDIRILLYEEEAVSQPETVTYDETLPDVYENEVIDIFAEYAQQPEFVPLADYAFPSLIEGIGILTIESINLRLPIAEGVDYDTLRIAPGRVPQTAQVGEVGNAVIAGHRNYAHGSMFNRLGELELGDIVQFQSRIGEHMAFEVFEIAIIEPHDQIAFIQPVNASIITLYTCTPIRTATHRLIIRGQRIELGEEVLQ
jgi:sortase A